MTITRSEDVEQWTATRGDVQLSGEGPLQLLGLASLAEARERAERRHIEEAISQTHGEIAKAASLLGVSRTTLWEKMRRLGLA